MGHILIPFKLIHYGSFVLLISLLVNCIGIIAQTSLLPGLGQTKKPRMLPITPRSVALTFLGAGSDPIHSAHDWHVIYPPGMGFVRLDGSYYRISMYHQLHCINSFRGTIERYRAGDTTAAGGTRIIHLTHCLAYVRQSVLCNSDVSLEPMSLARTVDGETVHATSGEGVTHECRDWSEVYGWAARNHLEWEDDDDFELL